MRDEDIFGNDDFEIAISYANTRFKFALARKCKLYNYDKEIGVNFSVYFDNVDKISFNDLQNLSSNYDFGWKLTENNYLYGYRDRLGFDSKIPFNVTVLLTDISVFNYDTNDYDDLGSFLFNINQKKWSTVELKLKSANINDDSSIKIKFDYKFIKTKPYKSGLLGRILNYSEYVLSDNKTYELSSVLNGERKQYDKNNSNNIFDKNDDMWKI